jgi:hypothetical protein
VFHFKIIGVDCRPAWSKPSPLLKQKEYDFGLAQQENYCTLPLRRGASQSRFLEQMLYKAERNVLLGLRSKKQCCYNSASRPTLVGRRSFTSRIR